MSELGQGAMSAEVEHAAPILFEALQLTGADTSGYDGWRHWAAMRPLALMARELREEVRHLRADYDEALTESTYLAARGAQEQVKVPSDATPIIR